MIHVVGPFRDLRAEVLCYVDQLFTLTRIPVTYPGTFLARSED